MTISIPSEGRDINLKKIRSFKLKLWLYFVLFTAIIFSVLWLLQTVFLQSFYNQMLIHNTKEAAQKIVDNSQQADINNLIDKLTHDNSFLVYITDEQGTIYYSADEYKERRSHLHGEGEKFEFEFGDNKMMPENKGEHKPGSYRILPSQYDSFLKALKESGNGIVEYSTDTLYVYGTYINYYGEDSPLILYISVTIDTVGPSAAIISVMLLWVTILSILIGFILSWFIARRFARPVDALTKKADKLGDADYSSDFRKGFCSELDGLSDTLDSTNEKLQRAKDFQMELLANVSHDLRTPLTMIKGYAEMIQEFSWEDEAQCKSDLAVIIKESDRLTALVNEILEYSELQTESLSHDLEEVDLSGLVNRVADSFAVLYKPEGVVIGRDIESAVFLRGNASRLERAFYNLMDNAVRHTGESKTVRVTLQKTQHQIVASVTDYGKGIPLSEQEHIWDRYYTSRQRGGKGVSGLGLAIVRQIVTMHKGVCTVDSTEGKGSTFSIRFDI